MNKETKQKWIEALLSGKYRQGKGVLRTAGDSFCCLGVLCDVVNPGGWGNISTVETSIDDNDAEIASYVYAVGESKSSTTLPCRLREHVGLSLADVRALIAMNDEGRRFSTIAKHIEANVAAE